MEELLTYTKKFSKIAGKKIISIIAPPKPEPPVEIAFMTCIIRVDVGTPGWQKAVLGVLRSSKGVRCFRMDDNGFVEVSGTVNPNLLLKMLAKYGSNSELCWFQFGQCSSNLFVPEQSRRSNGYGYGGNNHSYYNNNNNISDGAFLQYSGYNGSRPQFRPPTIASAAPTAPALGGENIYWFT